MFTAAQLRAARGLLDWTRAELAKASGMSQETIKNIEHGTYKPQEATIDAIIRTFAIHDVEFADNEGVRRSKNQVRLFTGKEGYRQFLDHIYLTLKDGGRIRQFNLSDGKNLVYADDYAKVHLERMKNIPNLDARVLTVEGDRYFPAPYCIYRWLEKANKILIPYYVYGDYLSQPIYKSENNVEIVSIHSKLLAERYVEQFELFWDSALIPDNARNK